MFRPCDYPFYRYIVNFNEKLEMLIELGIIALLVLLVAIIYEVIIRMCEPNNLPPGLRISPLLVLLLPRPTELPFVRLAKFGKKFNGVFTMKMGFKNTVMVDNVAVAREALVQRGEVESR